MKTIVHFHPAFTIEAQESHENSGSVSFPNFAYLYVDAQGQQRHVQFDKPRSIDVMDVGKVHTDDLKTVFGWLVPDMVNAATCQANQTSVIRHLQERGIETTEAAQRAVRMEKAAQALEGLRAAPEHVPTGTHDKLGTRVTRFDA